MAARFWDSALYLCGFPGLKPLLSFVFVFVFYIQMHLFYCIYNLQPMYRKKYEEVKEVAKKLLK